MKISQKELTGALGASLARHKVPGASIAVLSENRITTAVAGVTNVATGVRLTPETIMHIGSITKVFTATLVMQLVDEGRLDLDSCVLRYLPDLRIGDQSALEEITVKMLLNHTSGIDGDILQDYGHDEETIEKGIARLASLRQKHRPGAASSYCNPGTVIAGYLAQRLWGKSWYRLVSERIFQPLRMSHAAALPEEAILHSTSVGHYIDADEHTPKRTSFAFLPLSYGPAGTTLMMSATDLLVFAQTHMANGVAPSGARILSGESVSRMQQISVSHGGAAHNYADGIGLGWMVFRNGLLHHVGGGPGIISVLYVYPERGFAAAILTNAEYGLTVINEFMEPWLGDFGNIKPLGMVKCEVPSRPPSIDAERYVGVYEDLTKRFTISRTPDGLVLSKQIKSAYYENISLSPTAPTSLLPAGGDVFILKSDNMSGSSIDASRVFTFTSPASDGYRFLGNFLYLYPKTEGRST